MVEQPREIIINQALCRPDHLWGAERELVLISALIAITLVVLAFDLWVTLFAIAFWLIVYTGLKMMAKADPVMSRVYIQHIKYRSFYPARSSPFADNKKTFRGW